MSSLASGKQALDLATKELGPNSSAIQGNVSKLADLERFYLEAKTKFGGIDILFINAGQPYH